MSSDYHTPHPRPCQECKWAAVRRRDGVAFEVILLSDIEQPQADTGLRSHLPEES